MKNTIHQVYSLFSVNSALFEKTVLYILHRLLHRRVKDGTHLYDNRYFICLLVHAYYIVKGKSRNLFIDTIGK